MEQNPAEVVKNSRRDGQPVIWKVLDRDIPALIDQLRLECLADEHVHATDYQNGMCVLVTCSKVVDPDCVSWAVILESPERKQVLWEYLRALCSLSQGDVCEA